MITLVKYFDINEEGYSVRCKLFYHKDIHDIENVVIATHGFGGSKEIKAFDKFSDRLTSKFKSFGVICFDWPCHGADARKKLLISECMKYMDIVTAYAKDQMGAKAVYNYSTSFGGFMTLKYIADWGNPFKKIALRCPAVKLHDTMSKTISNEDKVKLSKGKEIMLGFERKMKVDQSYLDELKASDVFKNEYFDYADDMIIIHGTKDTTVPFEWSQEFAEKNVIELIPVENTNHTFTDPKSMDFAIHTIVEFFTPEA